MFTVNKDPDKTTLHKFGGAMVFGFGVIGAVVWLAPWFQTREAAALTWSGSGRQVAALCLWALGVILCAGSFGPHGLARKIYVGWMGLFMPVGVVFSTLLLTLLFVLLLPLFALVVRQGDPLRKKLSADGTYWEDFKPHEPSLDRLRRPF